MARPSRNAVCHPDRRHLAHDLCASCYQRERLKRGNNRARHLAHTRARYRVQAEECKRKSAEWRAKNPDKVKAQQLRRKLNPLERERRYQRYWADPEKYREVARRTRNPYRAKAWRLSRYGITPEQYDEMFVAQGGLCLLCGLSSDKTLAVDHCHKTGRIRGLLCIQCNSGMGALNDDPALLQRAIDYLTSR